MRLYKALLAASIGTLVIVAAPAEAATITYSFTNVVGNVSGTVFGHIDGLIDNSTSSATAVWVDSFPAALGGYTSPFNVFNWSNFSSDENSFTLVGGVVTAAFFHADGSSNTSSLDRLYLNSACACAGGTGHTNFLSAGTSDALYVWNTGNFNTADGLLIPAQSQGAVPEPATWAMMLFGFGAIGFSVRRRRKGLGIAQLA